MEYEQFDVVKKKVYEKNGEEKVSWQPVGSAVLFTKDDGSKNGKLDIPAIGEFHLFPKKENNRSQDEITPEDIPF